MKKPNNLVISYCFFKLITPNLETGWVDRNEAVGIGHGYTDRVRSRASGEMVEHSMKLPIYATSLHLRSGMTDMR